jgi:hypothetical protein
MSYTQVYRSNASRAIGALTVLICGMGLVTLAFRDDQRHLIRFGAWVVLAAWLVWLAYWRPKVVVDDDGVVLHNVFRVVRVPWSAVVELHSRYGLEVQTPSGSYNAWAVPAPFGRERLRGADTEAALMARQRLERLRGRGELDTTQRQSPRVEVLVPEVVVTALLAAAALLGVVVAG